MRSGVKNALLWWLLSVNTVALAANPVTLATISVPGGIPFRHQLDAGPSQAGAGLQYSLVSTDGTALPQWLGFDADNQTLYGTPGADQDLSFNWTLVAEDEQGSRVAAHTFLFTSAVPCLEGRYRHWRVRISTGNDASWYDTLGVAGGRSALCSVSWDAGGPPHAAAFPNAFSAASVSGVTTKPQALGVTSPLRGAEHAFQQLVPASCDVDGAWLVSSLPACAHLSTVLDICLRRHMCWSHSSWYPWVYGSG